MTTCAIDGNGRLCKERLRIDGETKTLISFFGQPSITAALPLTKKSYTQLHQLRATLFSFYKDTAYKDVSLGNGQYLRTWYFISSYLYCFPRLRFSVAKSNSIRGFVCLSIRPSLSLLVLNDQVKKWEYTHFCPAHPSATGGRASGLVLNSSILNCY